MSLLKPLYGCVVIAQFAAQTMLRLRLHLAGSAVVVMHGAHPHETVYATNRQARTLGLRDGMSRIEIETSGPVQILTRSRSEEQTARQILLECTSLFSPRVEQFSVEPHWECVLDLSGTERLLGEPSVIGQSIVDQMRQFGFIAYVAVCGNCDAGLSLARSAAHQPIGAPFVQVIPECRQTRALASLPLDVLDLDADTHERLTTWGIASLGELAALPEIDLIARMGQEGKRLRLRARGELPHLLQPGEEKFRLEETMKFDDPIETLEPLLFCMNLMLDRLIFRAQSRSLALASVTVSLWIECSKDRMTGESGILTQDITERKRAKPFERTVRPVVPTLDRLLLLKILELNLEAHPPPGAVMCLQLIGESGSSSCIQLGLFTPQTPEPARFEDMHARLVTLVGEGNVGRVRPMDTHALEAFVLERFKLPRSVSKAPPHRTRDSMPATSMRRMRSSVEVRVWLHNRQIHSFVFEAQKYKALRSYGPWRSSGDWWSPEIWSLDAWDVAAHSTDGELLICIIGHDLLRDRWQMEALYD